MNLVDWTGDWNGLDYWTGLLDWVTTLRMRDSSFLLAVGEGVGCNRRVVHRNMRQSDCLDVSPPSSSIRRVGGELSYETVLE
jgi:hypothetical protein